MDQRVKGGKPPNTGAALYASSPPDDSEQNKVAEKRRKGDGEHGDVGGKEEERQESGKKKDGNKGAVLEFLIEGRCGSAGQQQLQISGRETSCPEGNLRLRIGLQTKRTKKPPKILESYVCKPTFRTYQRQGRGPPRGDGEQEQQGRTPAEASRDQGSAPNAGQPASKQSACPASPPLSSVSSSSLPQPRPLSPALPTVSPPPSVSAVTNQGTKSTKQVPVKLDEKSEGNSSGRVKKEKVPSVNGQPDPAGHKSSSSTPDQAVPTACTSDTPHEGNTCKKHNGLVHTTKQKGLPNGKGSVNGTSSKLKCGKQSNLSNESSVEASRSPDSQKEPSLCSERTPDSPSPPSPEALASKPPLTSAADPSSPGSPVPDPSLHSSLEKDGEKGGKAKEREKLLKREKKLKRHRLERERVMSGLRREEGVKKKKKRKDGKSKHNKEKDQRHKSETAWWDDLKGERGKYEKKNDRFNADGEKTEDNLTKGETVVSCKTDKTSRAVTPGRPPETDRTDDRCKALKQPEPATDVSYKSKEQDLARHSAALSGHVSSAPPSVSAPPARAPISPPGPLQEQDSRPLKKRKARRPSWTKLVQRAQRAENQGAPLDSQLNPVLGFSQSLKTSLPDKGTLQQTHEQHHPPSLANRSPPVSSPTKPPSPKQSHFMSDPKPPASQCPASPVRKRGRPKSHGLSFSPSRLSLNSHPTEVPSLGCDGVRTSPLQEPGPALQRAALPKPSPKKRGRPPKRTLPEDQVGNALTCKDLHPPEKRDKQLKIRRLINEMKKRKKRRLHKAMLSGFMGQEGKRGEAGGGDSSLGRSIDSSTLHSLSALSSSFGTKLGTQINVSKRGTIYMGKRRGRKPKIQVASTAQGSQNPSQPSLFTNPSETSLFLSQPQHPGSHPFPSPSLTHSSGAHSPYSEGSLTEPMSSFLFSHPFSLPSPSSSCTSPRPPSSSSLSSFVKKSCPCQGRHRFPFHQSSCKLSCLTPLLHPTPGSPGHLKDTTPSPRSESHSDETLPSDSGIGTDNNSVSERGEVRGVRGVHRLGQSPGAILGGVRQRPSLGDRPSPVSSPLANAPRHKSPIGKPAAVVRHRDRHRHRRRDYTCPASCTCMCSCTCPGHNKCVHSDCYSCLENNALKRQKNKHKKKHQQLHRQDPEFLAELDDLIGQFSEVHIGRRGWAKAGLGQGFDGNGTSSAARRHHSPHSLCPNIFRINLNGFYSPHPSSYPTSPPFPPQPFYPCQPLLCNRKSDRRQCGCPLKFQETLENMAFYNSYPPSLYHHLPSSYPLPSPHQFAPHQTHHAHFLLNPARFHRRRSRLLQEGALRGEMEGDLGGGGGGLNLGSGFASGLSCGCGRSEHKLKQKHRNRLCERDVDDEEELQEDEEDDGIEKAGSSRGTGFVLGRAEGGRKGGRGMGRVLSRESPWLCEKANNSLAPAASAAAPPPSLSAERYKHTALTSLGLGSSHLSSFGGGWSGLGHTWTKFGALGATGFGNANPSWRSFSGEQHAERETASDGEDEAEDEDSPPYRTPESPRHTNLFTSAAMAERGRGLRSGDGERSWRSDESAWTERREAGLLGDWRGWDQRRAAAADNGEEGVSKRRPGRPRKRPLPSALPSPKRSSAPPPTRSPDFFPDGREGGARREDRGPERSRGGGAPQQVAEPESHGRKRKKRKHGDSPYHQSADEDTPPECYSPSEDDEAQSQTAAFQREERADGPPRKKYLLAGLYSDDYKTADPPSQSQQMCRESLEYTPGEHEYSLLPAPIHVGKYLRLKRIHFQLPYDVMWQWQRDQLDRPPTVPLKRKRRYCRLKERAESSHQRAKENSHDISSLFPHLNMELLTSSERSFVVKHRVFLMRNWELVRDRQIRLRIESERDAEAEDADVDSQHLSCDGSSGDGSHIKSDQPVGRQGDDPRPLSQEASGALTASPCPTKTPNRQEEEEEGEEEGEEEEEGEGEEGKQRGEEICSREQRRKRLNDLLLTLQHS